MAITSLDDTIAAISTPIGPGGIGIVRLSGPQALPIAQGIFCAHSELWQQDPDPQRLYYGHIVDPSNQCTLDEVLLSYMKAPHTFTRQDVVEINAHGGLVPLQLILSLCLASGARLAHEGEFTMRAFVNGRLDLAQAEAVLDIINAKTEASLRIALDQLGGRLSSEIRSIRLDLLDVLAYAQASIDFADDEVPAQDVTPALSLAQSQLEALLDEAERGIVYRQGVRTAIIGRPNVGKSSLLNALLRTDRAIVTAVPGTTRDTLAETVNLQGIPFVLVDTAGIVESDDLIERIGVERSRISLREADLVVLVVDGSVAPSDADWAVAKLISSQPQIVVVNKCDLSPLDSYEDLLPHADHLAVSALTGQGISTLERALVETVFSGQVISSQEPAVSNPRHRDLIDQALTHVKDARQAHEQGLALDLLTIDVTEAIQALGQVTGEDVTEDLIDTIFASFCIGK